MMTHHPFFTTLKDRGLLRISGIERQSFLQNLITNDMALLKTQPALYACLLTPQGKFLFDFFMSEEHDTLILECEGGARAEELGKVLNMYKLRAQVDIEVIPACEIYAVVGHTTGYPDPRHTQIGRRCFEKPKDMDEQPFSTWDRLRISLTIPDGSRDLRPGTSTMDEGRIDRLHGVSYDKGCYLGQELTARMHYRGLGKKHLYSVTPEHLGLDAFPAPFTPLEQDGQTVGEMRSSCGDLGLALLKDEAAAKVLDREKHP